MMSKTAHITAKLPKLHRMQPKIMSKTAQITTNRPNSIQQILLGTAETAQIQSNRYCQVLLSSTYFHCVLAVDTISKLATADQQLIWPVLGSASSIENHIILADVSDHFGTLSKIEGITREAEKQNTYYRKSNLTEEQWEQFALDWLNTAKNKIPFPHALDANSFGRNLNAVCKETSPLDHLWPKSQYSN